MARIPINIVTGTLQKEEIIVGIDLGTTNSLIAVLHPETREPIVLKEFDNTSLVPSLIYFDEFDMPHVGDDAKLYLASNPERTIYSAKRLMGKNYDDLKKLNHQLAYEIIETNDDRLVRVKIGEKNYSPIDLSAIILKKLKERAEHILKTPVNKAVITVPAYFNDAQRQATKDAGKLAGLDVLRIINEPTAASLAYGWCAGSKRDGKVVVYDLGGGTFDVSVMHIDDGVFEVLSTNGNTYLGGDDIDQLIVQYFINENKIEIEKLNDKKYLQLLRLIAEKAKKHLSENNLFETNFDNKILKINIEKFNELIQPIINQTIESCNAAMKDAGISKSEIDNIVVVGGSTRIPFIKKSLSNYFGKNVDDTVNPDEVVALGAAVQADILAGNNKEILLLDVTPLSLGVETMGGLMDVLIPRNSKIPIKFGRQYTTQKDGQTGLEIKVFQGERDMVSDNRKLAEFILKGIPNMPAGLPKIEIGFQLNTDGILTVTAKELRSGISQTIEVKPQLGLNDSDLEKMLLDSIDNAEADIKKRALAEAKTEGEQLLHTTEKFIAKNLKLLTPNEIQNTAAAMQNLQLAIDMEDKNLIQTKTDELNVATNPYAERVMNEAIAASLKGKNI